MFIGLIGAAPLAARALELPSLADAIDNTADISLAIAPLTIEIAPGRAVRTIGYNGSVPGPAFRMTDGASVVVDVSNATQSDELVHWHGFSLGPAVDGVAAYGTPPIPAGGRRRYAFTAGPAGTRWYHSHADGGAGGDGGTFTGQFGFAIVQAKSDPARYDREVLFALHEWEPEIAPGLHARGPGSPGLTQPVSTAASSDMQDMAGMNSGSMSRPSMLEATYSAFTVNGLMLGAGDPIRVRRGDRVLFRVLNASATLTHRLAFGPHRFDVIALDGNPLPRPVTTSALELGPGERVDALVAMDQPGVWTFGSTQDEYRARGLGAVVEYAGSRGASRWVAPHDTPMWDYTRFGHIAASSPAPLIAESMTLHIEQVANAANRWTINGATYPQGASLLFALGKRYRIIFVNASDMEHPMHLHGHSFELSAIDGKPTAGVVKDTVVVRPGGGSVQVDLVADNPGRFLLHCHNELHMMGGLAAETLFEPR